MRVESGDYVTALLSRGSLTLYLRSHNEKATVPGSGSELSPEVHPAITLISDFQPPKPWKLPLSLS